MTDSPFTTDDLVAGSSPEPLSPGRFVWTVPDLWQQGRGAFGGLVLAAMVRALETTEPEKDRLVRAVNAEIAGPVSPGQAIIEVTRTRRGNGLSAWNATLSQQDQTPVRLSGILARTRNTDPPRLHLSPPAPPPWNDVPPIPMDRAPGVPVFTRHVEFRPTGPLPFSGAAEPLAEGWVRFRHPVPAIGAPEIVALCDTYWPAALASAPAPRPASTVAFSAQIFRPDTLRDPSLPFFFYRARALAEEDGYMAELRELWSADLHLVALNQQTFAWIR